jgi:hydroxypyruvate reductase
MYHEDPKPLLAEIHRAALAAVAPGPALISALRDELSRPSSPSRPSNARVWVIALGKAAPPMAEAAVGVLGARGDTPAGGLVVAPVAGPQPHASIAVVAGDHPAPGAGSLAAADALDRVVQQVSSEDTVWVLLSGGTTSLIGAPQPGIAGPELTALYTELLRSGLDIHAMNRVRKRFTRWGAGRLARSLSQAAGVQCYIVSDVIGDDLAAIGSGPCVADPSTATDVREALVRAGLWDGLGPSLRQHLEDVERGAVPETPKPGDRGVDRVENTLIATNRLALDAAGRRATELGLVAEIVVTPIVGEAAMVGLHLAETLVTHAGDRGSSRPTRCLILGGETTVTIRNRDAGLGGRSQELALAAARVLRGVAPPVALLAAGTDGRDGPTDAAGAIVDGSTWDRIAAAGRDPQRDLERHDSYAALAAAEALIKTGPSGTNVMDIVLGVT